MLSVTGLSVSIKGFTILRNVSLDIPSGGLIALVGRNGAGKTTTLRSIMGLQRAASGRIEFDGVDLIDLPGHQRAPLGIGYLPEDRRLIGQLTVRDNLLLPAWAARQDRPRERLDSVLRLMPEASALADRRAAQLSGGQQKMVALARALMTGTKLLLLDEPFEGLSPALGEKLAETIRRGRQEGRSVLIAESDLTRIRFVDTIYTIERGEIIR
jgi:branched-chain amino acid transport system ATP-binding protein